MCLWKLSGILSGLVACNTFVTYGHSLDISMADREPSSSLALRDGYKRLALNPDSETGFLHLWLPWLDSDSHCFPTSPSFSPPLPLQLSGPSQIWSYPTQTSLRMALLVPPSW